MDMVTDTWRLRPDVVDVLIPARGLCLHDPDNPCPWRNRAETSRTTASREWAEEALTAEHKHRRKYGTHRFWWCPGCLVEKVG
jgi:hypothetical protein